MHHNENAMQKKVVDHHEKCFCSTSHAFSALLACIVLVCTPARPVLTRYIDS
jgi:hypothetical protein